MQDIRDVLGFSVFGDASFSYYRCIAPPKILPTGEEIPTAFSARKTDAGDHP